MLPQVLFSSTVARRPQFVGAIGGNENQLVYVD